MCIRVAGIELDGAAVVDNGVGIFAFVERLVAFGEEFLGVAVAAAQENQSEREERHTE